MRYVQEGELWMLFLCVSGDGRDTVHSSGIRLKKKKDMFGYGVTEMERGESNPQAVSRDLLGQICNSEQPPWVWEIGFPWLQQVSVMEVASVICRFCRRQCKEAPWEWSEIQSCMSLLSRTGETQTLQGKRENKEWQKWNIMNACRNLKVPAISFSRTGASSARGSVWMPELISG